MLGRLMPMNTIFLLMAQYDGRVLVPLDQVCRDFFLHLTFDKFLRKLSAGEIDLPVIRIEASQKSVRGIHLQDLAAYIDKRRAVATSEMEAVRGG